EAGAAARGAGPSPAARGASRRRRSLAGRGVALRRGEGRSEGVVTGAVLLEIYVFVLACFAGWQLISKVPPTLHTPLMSGANAISGITVLGALYVAQESEALGFGLGGSLGLVWFAVANFRWSGGDVVTD